MKKLLTMVVAASMVMTMAAGSWAGEGTAPGNDPGASAGGEMMENPGASGGEMMGEPGGSEGDAADPGASGGESGDSGSAEAEAVEDDGIDAAISITDAGEAVDREMKEGFELSYYDGGSLSAEGISSFLFTSEDPAVNFYFSELEDNKENFFNIGGRNKNIDIADTDADFSAAATAWMESIGVNNYNSAIIVKDGGSDASCEPVISAKGWANLNIDGLILYAEGSARSAIYSDVVGGQTVAGPGSGGNQHSETPIVVIRDSIIETTGQTSAEITGAISFGNSGGRARGIQPQGMSRTYLYNTAIVSRTWGALSTDSARQNLDLVAYNSLGYSSNGYGAYADTSCHLYLYGTTILGASDGITASNDGEIYAVASDCKLTSTDFRSIMGKNASATVSPADYADSSDTQVLESVIAGGSTAVQFHMPDQMHSGAKNTRKATLYMEGGALITDEAYVSTELSPYTARYSGALLVTKSTQANVLLVGTELSSSCGVLIHSMINSDTNVNNIADGDCAPGSDYVFRDMEVQGDVISDDYQRALRITLDGTTLTGAMYSNTCEDWNAFCEAETDGGCIINEDGYNTVWGIEVTLENGSVWNVTETSTLTALNVGEGCTVNGNIIDNNDGTITVEPK